MTFQQLRYILEIAKHQSISKAATALFITQPALTKAVQNLEQELHITIFYRTNKGIVFTEDGRSLLTHAQLLMAQHDTLLENFHQQPMNTKTKLSIASQHFGFTVQAIADWTKHLQNMPYTLHLIEGKSTDVIEHVQRGVCKVGVLCIPENNAAYFERMLAANSLQFEHIKSVKQHVFMHRKHPLAHQENVTFEDLKNYPYLTFQKEDMFLHIAEKPLHLDSFQQIIYVADRAAMNDLLVHTNGLNLGTGAIVKNYMPAEIIAKPLINGMDLHVGIILKQDTTLPTIYEPLKIALESAIKDALM